MKKLFFLIAFLAAGHQVAAQSGQKTQGPPRSSPETINLKPRRIVWEGDTLFGYTRTQQNEIATKITLGKIDLETLEKKELQLQKVNNNVENLRNMVLLRDGEIKELNEKIRVRDQLIMQHEGLIELQEAEIKHKEKQLAKQKAKSRVFPFLGVALLILLLIVLL
jgi:peptidoglycan hydrolase CwlO-like protein